MAGGNESPRQKMIGMMYLVLTALLALQTSTSVLEKFIFIDEALHQAAEEVSEKNVKTLAAITAEVEKKKNRAEDVKALDKAKEVRELTRVTLEHLDELRKQFAIITGGEDPDGYDDVTGQLIGSKDYDIVGHYMVNEKHGDELKEELNSYAEKLSKLANDEFEPLAKDAKDLEIAKDDPNQNMKDFSAYYFEHTPTAAGMATISHMESEVLRYEQRALENIAELVGAKDIDFETIVPLIRPKSNTVAAGAKFTADLFITASSDALDPKFKYNGKQLDVGVTENGIKYGKIEFTASASKFDPKTLLAEASFKAEIELNDTTYTMIHNYEVAKPVIQVRSAAASALYMNCGNELNIQVPSLGTDYNP
ncbi:MAG: gliding motility protein GldM, partial [Cyclobacteriaceae bacterium]|nr:gliding motility protein GldM [Cyclobacteriaceae bacterium]